MFNRDMSSRQCLVENVYQTFLKRIIVKTESQTESQDYPASTIATLLHAELFRAKTIYLKSFLKGGSSR